MLSSNLKRATSFLTIMVAFVLCGTALAQTEDFPAAEPLVLNDEIQEYPLGLYLDILEDPTGELTIEEVSSTEFAPKFIPSRSEIPNYGFTDTVYWVRFRVDNQTRQTYEWLLEQGFANTQFIDLYTPLPDGDGFAEKQTGTLRPASTRDILYPYIIFSLTIPPQNQASYYLRFQNGASMTIPLTLWTKDGFQVESQKQQILHGLFYGVLIGLLVYNIFLLFFSFREASNLYYVTFLAFFTFFMASYDGYMQIYFLPDLSFLTQYYIPLSFGGFLSSMLLFANDFLKLKTHIPRFYQANIVILGVWGLFIILTPFTSYHVLTLLMLPLALLSLAVVFIAGVLSLRKGINSARFFLIAWSGLLVTLFLIFLVRLGILPSTIFNENAFRIGLLWMAVCWSIALADRVNLMKAETEAANIELQNSQHRLSEILEGLPVGVVLYGKDFKPSYVNQRTLEILNNPANEIQVDISAGRTLAEAIQYFSLKVVGGDDAYPLENFPIYNALHGQPASIDDVEIDQGDRRVPLEIWASPIKDAAGNVESAVVAFQDITQRKQSEMALRTSETRLRVITDNNFDGIAFMGRDRKVLYASPSYQRLVGKTAEELIGQSGIGLVHPDDQDYTAEKFSEALQQPNKRVIAEYRIPHKDGHHIWVETFAINLLDNPLVQAVVLNSHEITDRKQAEAELTEYRSHLESLVETRTKQLSAVNEKLQLRLDWLSAIIHVNQIMARSADFSEIYEKIIEIINYLLNTQGSFIGELENEGQQVKILAHSCRNGHHLDLNGSSAVFPESMISDTDLVESKLIYLSGEHLNMISGPFGTHLQDLNIDHLALVPLQLREQTLGYLGVEIFDGNKFFSTDEIEILNIFSVDIAQLIENSHLMDQSRAMIIAGERNRLARDLHDSVTQTLFTASVLAESTPRLWQKDRDLAQLNMEKLSLLIRGALAEMRSLLLELRSGELHNQNLRQLLTTLVEAGRVRTRAKISISIKGERELPDNLTLTFYYIAQEALNNAINHGKAIQIDITLIEETDSVELRLQDDGRGFVPQDIPEGHLGINIMLERAAKIGADLRIISEPGEGTEVILTWSEEQAFEDYEQANID